MFFFYEFNSAKFNHYMKKLQLFLILLFIILNKSKAQNPIWTFPNNYRDLNLGLNYPLPVLLNSYTSTHNAYPAPDGSLGFYVVDEYVYDGNGDLVGVMSLPTAVELLKTSSNKYAI